ncbi:MspA family porin [Nocardia otitidiscaviarum]|uniref:MspA family porin n=1 Tax=Nocardia otitidiscaviarum TaxID=1823 RepID=UPI0034DD7673
MGSGSASAELVRSPDHVVTKLTVDGWIAEASLVNVVVNTVPNLAQSPWTREAFVDATAIGNITGLGSSGVKSGVLRSGLQLGCNTDVSSGLQTGSSASIGPNASVTISERPSVNVGGSATVSPMSATIRASRPPRPRHHHQPRQVSSPPRPPGTVCRDRRVTHPANCRRATVPTSSPDPLPRRHPKHPRHPQLNECQREDSHRMSPARSSRKIPPVRPEGAGALSECARPSRNAPPGMSRAVTTCASA